MIDNVTILGNLLTVTSIKRLFDRTDVTLYVWRKQRGMPYVKIPGDRKPGIRFDVEAVCAWADDNGIEYDMDVKNEFLADSTSTTKTDSD